MRYQIFEGKELTEIGKAICDYCLAPDTASGAGIGCDNMTVLIVALLQGRTQEEWYAWVKDRVEKQYGRATPSSLPQLYSQSRMMSFKARMEAMQNRNNVRVHEEDNHPFGFLAGTGLSGFARVLGSPGGISFHPGSNIMGDTGTLMFPDESDDDEEELSSTSSFFTQTLPLSAEESPDSAKQPQANLHDDIDHEGDTMMSDATGVKQELQGEAPPPPNPLPNGDTKGVVPPVQQLSSQPEGDAATPVVKAEGLLDSSEDPLKAC